MKHPIIPKQIFLYQITMKNLYKFNIFSLLLLFISINVCAQEFNDGVLRYKVLDEEEATCEVTGLVSYEIEGELVIPEVAANQNTSYQVISIGNVAFEGASSIVSVTLPESIRTIGIGPFSNCQNLKEIIVDDKNKRYKSVDGVLYTTQIDTLIQCPASFRDFTVPSSVKVIEVNAFAGCEKLQSINFSGVLNKIGIGAFRSCSALVSITIPEGIESIDDYTFAACSSLATINFPSTLNGVRVWSFADCYSLKSLKFPESMKYLVIGAFYGCELQSITMMAEHFVEVDWDRVDHPTFPKLYVKEHLLDEYKNSYEWSCYFKEILPIPMDDKDSSGVESITVDKDAPFDIYNLNGMLVRKNAVKTDISGLNCGVYILKQGDASQRIMIR